MKNLLVLLVAMSFSVRGADHTIDLTGATTNAGVITLSGGAATIALQAAIHACAQNGGDRVVAPQTTEVHFYPDATISDESRCFKFIGGLLPGPATVPTNGFGTNQFGTTNEMGCYGRPLTFIHEPPSRSIPTLLIFHTNATQKVWFENLQFQSNGTNLTANVTGEIKAELKTSGLVFTNCIWTNFANRIGYIYNYSSSNQDGAVFSHVTVTNTIGAGSGFFFDTPNLTGNGTVNGTYAACYWLRANPIPWGTTNMGTYLEDSVFGSVNAGAITDGRSSCRFVVRRSVLVKNDPQNHEGLNGKPFPLAFEYYDCIMINTNSTGLEGCLLRGGTAIVFDNDFTRLNSALNAVDLAYYPAYSSSSNQWANWYGLNRTNFWNLIGPILYSGTHVGASGTRLLNDPTKNWTNNGLIDYCLVNLATGTGGFIQTNSVTNAWVRGSVAATKVETTFNPGDQYIIYDVLNAVGKPGNGPGDLLCCGSSGTIQAVPQGWPHESSEPVRIWNNTGNSNVHSAWPRLIVSNVDYTIGVPKPGYVKLVYPHPLLGGTPVIYPTISDIPNQTIAVSSNTAVLPVTIGAGQTNVANYTMSYQSTVTNIVPNGATNVIFAGSGANRTIQVFPKTGQSGSTIITATVTDEALNSASDDFILTCASPTNTPPNISSITNQNINPSSSTPLLGFTVSDFESNATNLVVTKASSDTSIISLAHITLSGTSTNRTVICTGTTNTGSSTITLTVTDLGGLTNASSFLVTVLVPPPSAPIFKGAFRRRVVP